MKSTPDLGRVLDACLAGNNPHTHEGQTKFKANKSCKRRGIKTLQAENLAFIAHLKKMKSQNWKITDTLFIIQQNYSGFQSKHTGNKIRKNKLNFNTYLSKRLSL